MKCAQCTEQILVQTDLITCSDEVCKLQYHYSCAGFSQAMFRKLTTTHKEEWRCLKCKSANKTGIVKETKGAEGKDEDAPENLTELMKDVSEKLKLLYEVKEDLKNLKKDNGEIKDSQTHISQQYDDINKKLECLPQMQKEINRLHDVIQQKDQQIKELFNRLNQLEQYGRNKNIEINEVAERKDEDVEQIVVDVAKKMGVELKKEDIEIAHRLPKTRRDKRPATIIAQLVRRKKREEFLAARSKIVTNNQVTGLGGGRIYVSENLSTHYRNLLRAAKNKGKELGFKYVWYKNGSVRLRKEDASDVIIVNELIQLDKLK